MSNFSFTQVSLDSFCVGGSACFIVSELKHILLDKYNYDDACDVFAVHGVGGIVSKNNINFYINKFIMRKFLLKFERLVVL